MHASIRPFLALLIALPFAHAAADDYEDAIRIFRDSSHSPRFFNNSYGYAVFPTIGKGGFGIGGQKFGYKPKK